MITVLMTGAGVHQAERGRHDVCQPYLHQDPLPGALRVPRPAQTQRPAQRPVCHHSTLG